MEIFGIISALVACVFQISKDSVSKHLSKNLSGLSSAFASFLYPLPLYVVLLLLLKLSGLDALDCSKALLIAVVLRAAADTGAEWCKMTAFRFNQLSTVSMIGSLQVVLVVLFSPFITGDSLNTPVIVAAVLATVGTFLYVYDPKNFTGDVKALLPAAGFLLFAALNACFDRLASHNGSPSLAAFLMTALSAAFLALPATRNGQLSTLFKSERKNLWTRAVLEVLFMPAKLTAFRYLTAPEAATLLRLYLVLSFLVGWLRFGEKVSLRRIAGLILIFCGSVAVAWFRAK